MNPQYLQGMLVYTRETHKMQGCKKMKGYKNIYKHWKKAAMAILTSNNFGPKIY